MTCKLYQKVRSVNLIPVLLVTFYQNGQEKGRCYLSEERANQAIRAWQARGDGRRATKQ